MFGFQGVAQLLIGCSFLQGAATVCPLALPQTQLDRFWSCLGLKNFHILIMEYSLNRLPRIEKLIMLDKDWTMCMYDEWNMIKRDWTTTCSKNNILFSESCITLKYIQLMPRESLLTVNGDIWSYQWLALHTSWAHHIRQPDCLIYLTSFYLQGKHEMNLPHYLTMI